MPENILMLLVEKGFLWTVAVCVILYYINKFVKFDVRLRNKDK